MQPEAPKNSIIVQPEEPKKPAKNKRPWLGFMIAGIIGIIGGLAMILGALFIPEKTLAGISFPTIPSEAASDKVYSKLTGEELASGADINAPAYCIQTPNGTDGARPQAGLTQAGVVFEAIAEAGITRFAAIYQNPTSAVIGPIRSLRIYYLQWDTPFDCTIVHAGGSGDALAAVASGGYKDLTENYTYMYRGTYGSRLWNNLFTTSSYLAQFSNDSGYTTSDIKGFSRMTPEESSRARVDASVAEKLVITEPATGDLSSINATVQNIALRFGGWASFNVNYAYDASTNSYKRGYESGVAHEVYECPAEDLGERNPEDVCTLTQMSPNVVIAMVVQESKASDNYHEDIKAVGSGNVYIFQNGTAIKGEWVKGSAAEQIKFYDEDGDEIKLAPGQTFVEAIPSYGSIEY
ncbi:DUF3048 domain-containing protein [Candidatus Saccharibacteria bacterium]|nr:DUF3048 domain-containing protein [Candidatus Saccharibacteria bacterium]